MVAYDPRMAAIDERLPHVGRPTPRLEDSPLVTGAARWTDNVSVPGTLTLGVVRSPMAHARIAAVDLDAARGHPDVVAAFTGAELIDTWRARMPVGGPDDAHRPAEPPVAVDKVRYVGEPVAVVVTSRPEAVEDAVELVDVRYDPLPSAGSLEEAVTDHVLLHDDIGTNVAFRHDGRTAGDVATAAARADVVLRRRYHQQRIMAVAMEPRAVLAEPLADDRLLVHTSTQVPHRIRNLVALVLGMERSQVRVVAADVGGGFGPKLDCYAEDLLCAALARRLGQPVRFTATRTEDLQTTHHSRRQFRDVTVTARRDGTLLGLDVDLIGDCGAYLSRAGANVQLNSEALSPGCYRWQAYRFRLTSVFTNGAPTAAYRGAGRPEAIFGVERAIDDLAAELGLDPADVRRRNFPAPDEFPFPSIGGLTFAPGDYAAALDRALELVDYASWRAEQRRRQQANDPRRIGIGLAAWIDRCGAGPGMPEYGSVDIDDAGAITVRTGLGPSGQGTATSLAQIVADTFGVDPTDISVVHGDTDVVPDGNGTFGSRSMAVGAIAVTSAADDVAAAVKRGAAELLEAAEGDLELTGGHVVVRGSPGASVSLAEVATAARSDRFADVTALTATSVFEPEGLTFPYGTLAVVAEVDTDTGHVRLLRVVGVSDCGEVVNPVLFDGQLHGGLAQGIAQALYEDAVYDEAGNLLTGTLVDYLVPGAPDMPGFELERMVTPSGNALGVKGVGEAGVIAAPPAVVNAVVDAVRDLGVSDVAMPCTPERVWRAIQEARAGDR